MPTLPNITHTADYVEVTVNDATFDRTSQYYKVVKQTRPKVDRIIQKLEFMYFLNQGESDLSDPTKRTEKIVITYSNPNTDKSVFEYNEITVDGNTFANTNEAYEALKAII